MSSISIDDGCNMMGKSIEDNHPESESESECVQKMSLNFKQTESHLDPQFSPNF